jgi:hypothetical protein
LMKTEADHPTIVAAVMPGTQPAGGRVRAERHGESDRRSPVPVHCGTELDFLYDGLDFYRIH